MCGSFAILSKTSLNPWPLLQNLDLNLLSIACWIYVTECNKCKDRYSVFRKPANATITATDWSKVCQPGNALNVISERLSRILKLTSYEGLDVLRNYDRCLINARYLVVKI